MAPLACLVLVVVVVHGVLLRPESRSFSSSSLWAHYYCNFVSRGVGIGISFVQQSNGLVVGPPTIIPFPWGLLNCPLPPGHKQQCKLAHCRRAKLVDVSEVANVSERIIRMATVCCIRQWIISQFIQDIVNAKP